MKNEQKNVQNSGAAVIRNHKDTVFRMLFHDRQQLLELYNAVNGTKYTQSEDIQIVTLDNAIYMNVKNDNAFILHDVLSLYEHQSTFTPNMPLRDLSYIVRELEPLITKASVYANKLVKIPTPRFVFFYNGVDVQPERQILKLSDAFATADDDPSPELKVLVLNINPGYNEELKRKCQALLEYMEFVEQIRKNKEKYNLDEAVEKAVCDCIHVGILKDFLEKSRAEVIAMSIFEYDQEEEIRKYRKAEKEIALEEGHAEGHAKGLEEGRTEIVIYNCIRKDFLLNKLRRY